MADLDPAAPPGGTPAAPAPTAAVAQPAPAAAPAPEPEPSAAPIPQSVFDRIDRLTRDKKTAEERAAALERQIASGSGAAPAAPSAPAPAPAAPVGIDPLVVERRAQEIAQQRVFTEKCNSIASAGAAQHPDFPQRMAQLGSLGVFSPDLINAASTIGEPHELLYELSKDLNLAASVAGLGPVEMALRLSNIASARKAKLAASVSSAPAPSGAMVGAGAGAPAQSSEPQPTDDSSDWFKKREAQMKARRG